LQFKTRGLSNFGQNRIKDERDDGDNGLVGRTMTARLVAGPTKYEGGFVPRSLALKKIF